VRRSRFFLGASVVLSALVLAAWFPAGALLHQRQSLASASDQLHQLRQQDAALALEGKALSSPNEVARIARSQYQLVGPGERPYAVLPPNNTSAAGAPTPGDPGLDGPVAPSAAGELPPGAAARGPAATPGAGAAAPAGSTTTTAPARTTAPPVGFWSRVLHSLEFWN
jgi:cell division protein FtsB